MLLDFHSHYQLGELPYDDQWLMQLLEGYVLSADTGSQDVVRASRDALVGFCEMRQEHVNLVTCALFNLLTASIANKDERIIPSVLEVIAFLFDMGIFQRSPLR